MFTETELREAMRHSAARADHLIEQSRSAESESSQLIDLQGPIDRGPSARRRTWIPLAAAAVAAAVAGGGLLLADKPAHRSPAAPQKVVPAATTPAKPSKPAVASSHAAVTLTNLATIPGAGDYTLNARMESALIAPGGNGAILVMALPAGQFDPAKKLTDPQPVSVAGTHGYAGKALVYFIDPNDAQQAGKAGAPRNTVVWPAGNGAWLVLQNYMADVGDVPVATLIDDAAQLGAHAVPAPLRSGYRARWLPAGLTLTTVDASVGKPSATLTLTAGKKSLSIQLSNNGNSNIPIGGTESTASKAIPGYEVSVVGTGYDQATVQRVLDGLDFSRMHGPQSGWWTFEQAVNG